MNYSDRTIKITKDTHVSPAFYNWFMANAKKPLNSYSWDEINEIALAGNGPNYFSIGDTKEVTLNGSVGYGSSQATFSNQKYWVYIIGFDHNSAKEGIGIAFQGFKTAQTGGIDVAVTGTNYGSTGSGMIMNPTQNNAGGWNGSWAYTTCMSQWKNCFPSELQAVIRTTTLYTDNTGNGSTSASAVTANSNEVYYLAEYEVFGSNTHANTNEPAQQAQYDYYKAGNSKVKYRSDNTSTVAAWWLRSPHRSNAYWFCCGYADGSTSEYGGAHYSDGSAPCFKVGNPPPLSGTWKFNSTLTSTDPSNGDISTVRTAPFTCSASSTAARRLHLVFGSSRLGYEINSLGDDVTVYQNNAWVNEEYRTITFYGSIDRNTNPIFYDWFVSNAVKQ